MATANLAYLDIASLTANLAESSLFRSERFRLSGEVGERCIMLKHRQTAETSGLIDRIGGRGIGLERVGDDIKEVYEIMPPQGHYPAPLKDRTKPV